MFKHFRSLLVSLCVLPGCGNAVRVGPVKVPLQQPAANASSFFDLQAIDIHGEQVPMSRFKGNKLLVVNTASECGFTPQYKQLQELYEAYKDKGLVVIGFPSNDFGRQEPGSEAEIEAFCSKNYGITFPMMAKVHTKGGEQHPVYRWLTNKSLNGVMDASVSWNFEKFLIDENGLLVDNLGSGSDPMSERVLNWLESGK